MKTQQYDDAVIDEVREVRKRISLRYHNDPKEMVAYYIALQNSYRDRLIRSPGASTTTPANSIQPV